MIAVGDDKALTVLQVHAHGARLLYVVELSAVFRELYSITSYPFACKPKPRMTWRGRWKQTAYFDWVQAVRMLTPVDIHSNDVALGVIVRGGLRATADLSNAYKAAEDAVRGHLFHDDNIKHVTASFAAYVPAKAPTFTIVTGSVPNVSATDA